MELQLVLERLAFTIEKAKELKPEQFKYSDFVTEFDIKSNCGTVCCIAGHYPNWGIGKYVYLVNEGCWVARISSFIPNPRFDLQVYHSLSFELIDFLFYGDYINHYFFQKLNFNHDFERETADIQTVIKRFELVYELIESGKITPDFPH